MSKTGLMSKKVPELKKMLKAKGLTTTGKKHELIDRLLSATDSSNASGKPAYDEFRNVLPPSSPEVSIEFGLNPNHSDDLGRCNDSDSYRNTIGCFDSTGISMSECGGIHMEPSKSTKTEAFQYLAKTSDDFEKLRLEFEKLTKVTLSLNDQFAKYDQKIAQLELKNAQLEQMVSELVKGSLDYEHERSNVVLYGVDKDKIDETAYRNKNEAIDMYALNFVQKYLPNYEATDIKTKSVQNDGAIVISMACSADAFRLTKRCRADGFTKIRQGLTKPERMISKAVTLKTAQLNSKSSRMSDKHYVKRHLHYIARVKKDDPRKPLALFTPEFNLTNLDGTVTFKLTNMIRKTNTYCKQAPESEQRPPNTIGSLNLPFE